MSSVNNFLIVGSQDDPHVVRVAERIRERSTISVHVVDPGKSARLTVAQSPAGEMRIAMDDWRYFPGTEASLLCWWRDKTRSRIIDSDDTQAWTWSWRERRAFLSQALSAAGARFLNDPGQHPSHEKLLQLRAARRVGFRCPPTLVTSDKAEALAFLAEHPSIIMKPLATSMMPGAPKLGVPTLSIPVCRVAAHELFAEDAADFEAAPMVFQREMPKRYEVRTLAIGKDARSFKIDSQSSKRGELDWRRAGREDIFSAMETPAWIVALCAAYLREVGLTTGSFDFIVDDESQWWFLECNPEGQWTWMEGTDKVLSNFFAEAIITLFDEASPRRDPTDQMALAEARLKVTG